MKNVFNKALLYKEVKSAKWITLIMVISIFTYKTMYLMNYERRLKILEHVRTPQLKPHLFNISFFSTNGDQVIMLLAVILLATILFKSERQTETYSFIASMPFKRKDIIKTKWFVGSCSIFISFFINAILISIIFHTKYKNIAIEDSSYIIFQWALINILTYISIFTMILFTQTLMGQNVAASIVGSIVMFFPTGLLEMIRQILRVNFIYSYWADSIGTKLVEFTPYFINTVSCTYIPSGNESDLYNNYFYEYQNYFTKIVVLIILIVLFYNLAIYIYKINKLENSGNLIMFSSLEPVFKWGFSICFGLFVATIVSSSFDGQNYKIITGSLLIIGSAAGYFISRKVVRSLSVS
ncbi:ABC-2 transporter permease [Tepidibacter hydrothermalis]|uniref:Uncharacterized protein n=1 Tax=Tepidibacter hydrothermalis TaxID=3036126 RepID=A0ABY8E9B5_9FIRM|nr:ABC-2 transporter permease [Tepidibacter hydrothermalis]WFD09516.1 hypothetical protein P4S50_14125 [Tepidibacter hydrothermalis]